MQRVVGVKFENTPKTYWFAAGELEYTVDCAVVVETARGVEMGRVRTLPTDIEDERIVQPLKSVLRLATEEDFSRQAEYAAKKQDSIRLAEEKVAARKLHMKIVDAQYTIDGAKLVLYFTSESRVDFRELVKDLASAFHTRIELRQIGTRDECKMIGGLGPCGRECCCSLGCDQTKVNIKMAKNQNLSLNPGKISGICGRLMCCLEYENEYYAEMNKLMPKVGARVRVRIEGKEYQGTVLGINQIKRTVRVRAEIKEDSFEIGDHALEDVIKLDRSSAADDVRIDEKEAAELKEIVD